MENARSRSFSWDDPLIGAQAAKTMSGMAYLTAMAEGNLPVPPIMRLINFSMAAFSEGRFTFTFTPAEYHYNPVGSVHGGVTSTLLDSALGCAVHTLLPAGTGYATVELHVHFVRPLTMSTGEVRCEAEVIHMGRSLATAQARLTDAEGKLYSHATTSCMIFRPE